MSPTITLKDDDPFDIPPERVIEGISRDRLAQLIQDVLNEYGYIDIGNHVSAADSGEIGFDAYQLADDLLDRAEAHEIAQRAL